LLVLWRKRNMPAMVPQTPPTKERKKTVSSLILKPCAFAAALSKSIAPRVMRLMRRRYPSRPAEKPKDPL